jgi:hypothetical protein
VPSLYEDLDEDAEAAGGAGDEDGAPTFAN